MSHREELSAAPEAADVVRRYAKYVFLDVVKFSKRSAEAQYDIVRRLNDIVGQSVKSCGVPTDDCIMLPTGDGMCIALIGTDLAYDVHLRAALQIPSLLNSYNAATKKSGGFNRHAAAAVGLTLCVSYPGASSPKPSRSSLCSSSRTASRL